MKIPTSDINCPDAGVGKEVCVDGSNPSIGTEFVFTFDVKK